MIFLDRECWKCGKRVVQVVFFRKENEEIEMQSYWGDCLVCQASLPRPTEKEIKESPYVAT